MERTNDEDFDEQILNKFDDENCLKCRLCLQLFVKPKFLSCTHTFCEQCCHKLSTNNNNLISIECPQCHFITEISDLNDLIDDKVLNREIENNSLIKCGQCSSSHQGIAHCLICSSYLCSNCCQAHKYMKCFEKHKLRYLSSQTNEEKNSSEEKDFELIKFDFNEKLNFINLNKQNILEHLDEQLNLLQTNSNQIKKEIEQTFNKYQQILNEVYNEYLSSLNHFQRDEEMNLIEKLETIQKGSQAFKDSQKVFQRCLTKSSLQEFIQLKQKLFDQRINTFRKLFKIENFKTNNSITFQNTPFKQFQIIIKNNFGQLIKKQNSTTNMKKDSLFSSLNGDNDSKSSGVVLSEMSSNGEYKDDYLKEDESMKENVREFESITILHRNVQNNLEELFQINQQLNHNPYPSSAPPLVDGSPSNEYPPPSFLSTYSSRDSSGSTNGPNSRSPTPYSNVKDNLNERPLIRQGVQPMQVRSKFGSLGPQKSQFNAPHGFCLGVDEEIIVADTNNHRIEIFDKTGEYKYQFGIPGREEGQLWYPRKVAIIRQTGKFVICDRGNERSRMQIFTPNGHFIKKISIRYIDILAGLAITPQGNIVAVDSVSPTVFCINESGDLLKWFDCSDYMREPSDIAVFNNEYFVCDFKGHCVVVFDEEGIFLRRIGSEHLTHFPNGIDISDAGDVIIGDSHGNRFHIAVFTRTGDFLQEYDCPYVKVSRCCGLKITSDGFIVTLAKNNHHVLVLNTLYLT